jgi:hypothetical protein
VTPGPAYTQRAAIPPDDLRWPLMALLCDHPSMVHRKNTTLLYCASPDVRHMHRCEVRTCLPRKRQKNLHRHHPIPAITPPHTTPCARSLSRCPFALRAPGHFEPRQGQPVFQRAFHTFDGAYAQSYFLSLPEILPQCWGDHRHEKSYIFPWLSAPKFIRLGRGAQQVSPGQRPISANLSAHSHILQGQRPVPYQPGATPQENRF